MGADDVVAAAEAVYAVPPATFTAERKARSAAARAVGNRDLAARIAALPKPSASAALVNRLVHDADDDLVAVLRLGAALREAQQAGDPVRLRALTAERRHLLDRLAADAADRAEHDGRRPGTAVLEELQQTLQAAMAGGAAAAAVRSGRLVRALTADGLEPADLRGAVAPEGSLPDPEPLPAAADAGEAPDPAADPAAEEAARRRAEAAQRAAAAREAADEAERAAAAARQEADERGRAAQVDRARVDLLRARLRDAEVAAASSERAAAESRARAADLAGSAARAAAAAAD